MELRILSATAAPPPQDHHLLAYYVPFSRACPSPDRKPDRRLDIAKGRIEGEELVIPHFSGEGERRIPLKECMDHLQGQLNHVAHPQRVPFVLFALVRGIAHGELRMPSAWVRHFLDGVPASLDPGTTRFVRNREGAFVEVDGAPHRVAPRGLTAWEPRAAMLLSTAAWRRHYPEVPETYPFVLLVTDPVSSCAQVVDMEGSVLMPDVALTDYLRLPKLCEEARQQLGLGGRPGDLRVGRHFNTLRVVEVPSKEVVLTRTEMELLAEGLDVEFLAKGSASPAKSASAGDALPGQA